MGGGDVEGALASAAATVTGRYTLEPVHQGYIEPHACVASWNGDGQAQIWTSSQGHFAVRSEEHTSELQTLMLISYAVFCLKKKTSLRLQTTRINTLSVR